MLQFSSVLFHLTLILQGSSDNYLAHDLFKVEMEALRGECLTAYAPNRHRVTSAHLSLAKGSPIVKLNTSGIS